MGDESGRGSSASTGGPADSMLAFAVVRLNDSGPCAFAGIARGEDGDGFNADLKCAAHAGDV